MSASDDDAEIINETDKSGWSDRLESANAGNGTETIYDPTRCYTAWMTVPDSLWTEVER